MHLLLASVPVPYPSWVNTGDNTNASLNATYGNVAAGPVSNLALAVSAAVALRLLPVSPMTLGEPNVSAPMASLLSRALQINVLLAVFNMIPIPPLDGGNVLAGLLPAPLAISFNRIRPYGFIVLCALILTNGFDYIVVPPYRFILSWLPTKYVW